MLKVASCTDTRTVSSSNFFGLMGYYYFVLLWGFAARAASSALKGMFTGDHSKIYTTLEGVEGAAGPQVPKGDKGEILVQKETKVIHV